MESWNTGTEHRSDQKCEIMAIGYSNDSISGTDKASHSKKLGAETHSSWWITGPTILKPLPRHSMTLVSEETKVVSSFGHHRTPKDYLHFDSPRRWEPVQWDSTAAASRFATSRVSSLKPECSTPCFPNTCNMAQAKKITLKAWFGGQGNGGDPWGGYSSQWILSISLVTKLTLKSGVVML